MRLYFFRHGIAQPGDATTPDFKRELTAEGRQRTQHAAEQIKALGISPDLLYSSPLIRARQTADILGKQLGSAVQVRREVGPGFDLQAVVALTRDLSQSGEALFVGHEPDLSLTIAALTGGHVVMKKGGFARVDVVTFQPFRGELVWLIAPKLFEQRRA